MRTADTRASASALAAAARTLEAARRRLLAERAPGGFWEGELSPSALSTATAVCALEALRRQGAPAPEPLVRAGLRWLAEHPNADGGFGDTPDSPSNPSTTTLCWAALGLRRDFPGAFARAENWLRREVGDLSAPSLAEAIARRYGEDRTFSAPILTLCALAGRFGDGPEAWDAVPPLPYELAALPRSWFRRLNLQVVSYALPALIAIGRVRHARRPSRNPFARLARRLAGPRTLRVLEAVQPASGGFLEAVPLTSFVTMSLAAAGLAGHPVARRGAAFLAASARPDGSWPIDTHLATWVTTLSVQALAAAGDVETALGPDERRALRDWLLAQQTATVHPYTNSAPGGWAWTPLSGGVPDADDTSGALLALHHLGGGDDPAVCRAAEAGVAWLLDLQNRDGGIPTFCRGWGRLPFDRSCPDLTAHALRAWHAWRPLLPDALARRAARAAERAFDYLVRTQAADGSWVPLWFGNQRAPEQENPLYGTSRVLLGAALGSSEPWKRAVARGVEWLLRSQNPDGGFGGAPGIESSAEETALGAEALAAVGETAGALRAAGWLAERTAEGARFEPTPIGLYFAKLWYFEKLYPIIFTVAALGRARERP